MKWLKPHEVTQPGDYLIGFLDLIPDGKSGPMYYDKAKIIAEDGVLVLSYSNFGTKQSNWKDDMRLFGPIPKME